MATKIVMVGARLTMNLGGPSLCAGTMKALRRFVDQPEFVLLAHAHDQRHEEAMGDASGVCVVEPRLLTRKSFIGLAIIWRLFRRIPAKAKTRKAMRVFTDADLVLDTWGIGFVDSLGTGRFWARATRGWFFVLAKLCRKPVVKYTFSFGPCRERWNRFFSRLYLNHFCDLIIAREQSSLEGMREVGITTPILACPDTAFLMDVLDSEISRRLAAIRASRPVVCISVSFRAQERSDSEEAYLLSMCELINHAARTYGAYVVIIPNELSEGPSDDRKVAQSLRARLPDVDCEILPVTNMRAEEIKGVIAGCDVAIAARYHTVIAALSSAVPVLVVSWHHKYTGVLDAFDLGEYAIDLTGCDGTQLISKFDLLWQEREKIRQTLEQNLPVLQEKIYEGARRTASLLKNKSKVRASSGRCD